MQYGKFVRRVYANEDEWLAEAPLPSEFRQNGHSHKDSLSETVEPTTQADDQSTTALQGRTGYQEACSCIVRSLSVAI